MFVPEIWGDIQRTWLPRRYRVQWSLRWREPTEVGGFTEHGSLGDVIVWGQHRADRRLAEAIRDRRLPP